MLDNMSEGEKAIIAQAVRILTEHINEDVHLEGIFLVEGKQYELTFKEVASDSRQT